MEYKYRVTYGVGSPSRYKSQVDALFCRGACKVICPALATSTVSATVGLPVLAGCVDPRTLLPKLPQIPNIFHHQRI